MQIVSTGKLEKLMEARGLSARALSLQAGLNETAVRDILAGRSKSTRPHTILRIADVLECKPIDIINIETIEDISKSNVESALSIIKDLHINASDVFGKIADSIYVKNEGELSKQDTDYIGFLQNFVDNDNINARRIDFTGANLDNASLRNAQIPGARFTGAYMPNADFYQANLQGASFEGAVLKFANFKGCNLQGASFVGSDMEGAQLKGADLSGTDFTGVDLSRVDWG